MTTQDDTEIETELELTEVQTEEAPEFEDEEQGEAEETEISFGDDDAPDDTPLVKKLREQVRTLQRQVRTPRADNDTDPEPQVPERPRSVADYEYDEDRFNAAIDAHLAAKEAHVEWKARQAERDAARRRAADEQTKQIEQQRRALNVSDYEDRSSKVKDTLSESQLAVLINGAENPAKLIYALGRSEARLEELAGIDNLARFAARMGQMEKEIRVGKKKPPQPETQVRGATASFTVGTDKKLEALEREADRTGDRSKVIAYKRQMRQKAA